MALCYLRARLVIMVEWLGVNKQYLLYGEEAVKAATEQVARWDSKITPEEREAIEAFLALPPDKRKLFGQLMKACGK